MCIGDRRARCSAWSAWRSKFHVRKRSYCPPKLLIEVFRSEVCNHVSKGLHCEFPTVSPIRSEALGTWAKLLDPFCLDHQVKRIRKAQQRMRWARTCKVFGKTFS